MGSVEYLTSQDRRFLIARFLGVLNEDVVWPALEYLVELDDSWPGYDLILDFSEVEKVDVSVSLIHNVGQRIKVIGRRTGKTAWLIGEYTLRRTFAEFVVAVLAAVSKSPGKVFGSYAEAEQWING